MCSAKTVTFGGVVTYPKSSATVGGTIEQTKARFNCIGTLRDSLKMVGSNGSKFLTVRLVRSKLRKREESAAAATAAATATATSVTTAAAAANSTTTVTTSTAVNNNSINNNNNVGDCQLLSPPHHALHQPIDVAVVTNVSAAGDLVDAPVPLPFLWQYSAKNAAAKNTNGFNSPYRLYSPDQDTLVCSVPIEENTAEHRKGLRKNLRGKWRRLVHKKQQQQDAYKIPAELRDQLKQIYVY
ncbi:Hypothetical protein CINCED_3A017617 [Cinara cedri]|uniref:Uncharacterized protein n=1 Tax=Cinara cedri TaxID=506608 RepID=A0A5E4NE31_9HEMI|nr:Hypothetical protein CINCED_3A017617 [Cinara cedri]